MSQAAVNLATASPRTADASATALAAVANPATDMQAALDSLPPQGAPWAITFERLHPGEAQRWRVVLVVGANGRWALLADRPCDALLLQWVEHRLNAPVHWHHCSPAALDQCLGAGSATFRALDLLQDNGAPAEGELPAQELTAAAVSAAGSPTVRLLDATLFDALQAGASDIHIECTPGGADIRLRIDGVLGGVHGVDGVRAAEQLVSRLKVMAELDIGERRLPQDGRFKLRVQGRVVDFRLSVIPSAHGEDAVVRLLDRAQIERQHGSLSLQALGLDGGLRAALLRLAQAPHGLLLVTGPTGSGKTTTLYGLLNETQRPGEKTITIEDPVEYGLAGTTQIPVNDKKGLGFARGLRAVLRHDPDRIMVGEIRDAETAEIAVQAALTGHVVFSSVHANSAFDVIGRLLHMGLDPYHVVSALNGVLAQRLVRQVCSHCSQPALDAVQALAGWRRAVGCRHCRSTGYRGRRAVAELLRLDDTLRDLITARAPLAQLKQAARTAGLVTVREAVLALVAQGITTLDEADRVTADD